MCMYVENILNLAHAAPEATSAEQRKFKWTKQLLHKQDNNQMKIYRYNNQRKQTQRFAKAIA